MHMEHLTLNDGHHLPTLGLGTYKATESEGVEAVLTALENGYRLIDSAAKYDNEEAVGKAIRQSERPREEIIVTTKLWRTDLGYHRAKAAFADSLRRLQLDYVDLYLIHWPANAKNYDNWQRTNADTWRALEELRAEGKIKSIGVSNFWREHLEALFETAEVRPAVNQIEFHPGYWQAALVEFCGKHQIAVQAWSPLARGDVFADPTLATIARRHEKSVAQVCLRWVIQHGLIAIPKSTNPERIKENQRIFDFTLSAEEMALIDNLPEMGFSGELPNIWPDRV